MEAGEFIALGAAVVAVAIELWRMRREDARFAATSQRLDDTDARVERREEAALLTDLQAALRELRRESTAYLEEPAGDRVAESGLRARITESRQLAEQAETSVLEAAIAFIDSCRDVLVWAGKEIPGEKKHEIYATIQDTFEVASAAVIGRQGALRRGDPEA